jgi:hypothetical protein
LENLPSGAHSSGIASHQEHMPFATVVTMSCPIPTAAPPGFLALCTAAPCPAVRSSATGPPHRLATARLPVHDCLAIAGAALSSLFPGTEPDRSPSSSRATPDPVARFLLVKLQASSRRPPLFSRRSAFPPAGPTAPRLNLS